MKQTRYGEEQRTKGVKRDAKIKCAKLNEF